MFPDPLNGLISFAHFQKSSHANDISIAGLVHQVSDHIVGFSVYVLFAGTVKMELRQLLCSVPDDQKIAGSRHVMVVHADRVTVVHDIFERFAPRFEA